MGVRERAGLFISKLGFNAHTMLVLITVFVISSIIIFSVSYVGYLRSDSNLLPITEPSEGENNPSNEAPYQPPVQNTNNNASPTASSSGGGGGSSGSGGGSNPGSGSPPESPSLLISFTSPTPQDGGSFSDLDLAIRANTSDDQGRYSFVDFNRDLLLWMRLENSNAQDESTYNHNTTRYGTQTILGKFGSAAQFASLADSIQINNSGALNPTQAMTVSLWFKGDDARYGQFLVGKWNGTGTDIAWFVDIASGGICNGLDFYVSRDGSSFIDNRTYIRSCNQTYQDGQWHHLVGTVKAGQEISLYVDGNLVSTNMSGNVTNLTSIHSNTQPIFIGSNANQFYNGSIDEFIIFNRSLSSGEVKAIYDSSAYSYNGSFSFGVGMRNITVEAHAVNTLGESNQTKRTIFLTSFCTLSEFMTIASNLTFSYKQWCDIDLSSFSNWQAFGVNGSNITNFTGTYDGNGYTISNLKQVNSSLGGLFGSVSGGTLRNITLANIDILVNRSNSYSSAGGLVALSYNSTILNCFINGSIKGTSYLGIGGLIGYSKGSTIKDSSSWVTVGSNQFNTFFGLGGGRGLGGLVGTSSDDNILNTHAYGYIVDATAGGLVGYFVDGIIDNSSASGNVSGCAGLVCHMESENKDAVINNSYAIGNIDGLGSTLGGLVGYMNAQANGVKITLISNSYALGNVTPYTSGGLYVGGSSAGGLVGGSTYRGFFENTSAYGTVRGSIVGGLVGSLVTSPNQIDLGFAIKKSSAHGTVICNGSQFPNNGVGSSSNGVGGLVGTISSGTNGATIGSAIQSSYATGDVITVRCASTVVGGLVGGIGAGLSNSGVAVINNSYAIGFVSSNATASVNGTGGLVGRVTNVSILNSYSTGAVSSSSGGIVGGLVGVSNYSSTDSSYWDTQTSGQATSALGVGKTTSQMQQQSTFTGWDFANMWELLPNSYPGFRWQSGNCGVLGCSPETSDTTNTESRPLLSNTVIAILVAHGIAILLIFVLFLYLHHKEHSIDMTTSSSALDFLRK